MSETKTKKKITKDGEILKHNPFATNSGNDIAPVYKKVYDQEKKREIVKVVDHFNINEFVQSSASTVDLAILKKRALEMGESAGAFVGDIDETLFPENIHDVYKFNSTLTEKFNGLEEGLKKQFGSVDKYRAAILNGSALDVAQKYFIAEAKKKAAEAAKNMEGENK